MPTRRNNPPLKSLFSGIDIYAIGLYVALALFGLTAIISASCPTWGNSFSDMWSAMFADSGAEDRFFDMSYFYMKQALWVGISLVVALLVLLVDRSLWHSASFWLYGASMLVLLSTLVLSPNIKGARAWLQFGGLTIQPMEFAKIAILLAAARMMSGYHFSVERMGDMAKVIVLLFIPLAITQLQNDLGSGLVLCSMLFVFYREGLSQWICIPIVFIAILVVLSFVVEPVPLLILLIAVFVGSEAMMNGIWRSRLRFVAALLLVSVAVWGLLSHWGVSYYQSLIGCSMVSLVPIVWYAYRKRLRNIYLFVAIFSFSTLLLPTSDLVFTHALKEHQQNRILALFGKDGVDTYNVDQAVIAVGSGRMFGKGFMQGSQVRYLLPEKHTDFIFSTIGEEYGFAGTAVVLLLLVGLIFRLMRMGDNQGDAFGRVYCYGVAAVFLFHLVINVGMNIKLLPVMGIPLPFVSYGGSSFLAFTIMLFIAISLDASTRQRLNV